MSLLLRGCFWVIESWRFNSGQGITKKEQYYSILQRHTIPSDLCVIREKNHLSTRQRFNNLEEFPLYFIIEMWVHKMQFTRLAKSDVRQMAGETQGTPWYYHGLMIYIYIYIYIYIVSAEFTFRTRINIELSLKFCYSQKVYWGLNSKNKR